MHKMVKAVALFALLAFATPCWAQLGAGSGVPYAPVCPSGDISGTWPNCVVSTINGAAPVTTNAQQQIASMGNGRAPSTFYILNTNVVSNSTTDTGCYPSNGTPGPTILANGSYAYNTYRLICRGVYTTGLANVSAATIKVKLGSVTIATLTTVALPISVTTYPFLVDEVCTIRATGGTSTSGSVMCNGEVKFWTVLTSVPSIDLPLYSSSPVTFDPTISESWQITSAVTSLVGSPNITATNGSVEILY